jgi:hypothetical protein
METGQLAPDAARKWKGRGSIGALLQDGRGASAAKRIELRSLFLSLASNTTVWAGDYIRGSRKTNQAAHVPLASNATVWAGDYKRGSRKHTQRNLPLCQHK